MGVQKHYQKRFTKKIVSKSFHKKFDQKSKTDCFSKMFYHVFGRFSMRGVQKHDKKNIEKINLTLVFFRTLTHPPTTGVTDIFFFGGPLQRRVESKIRLVLRRLDPFAAGLFFGRYNRYYGGGTVVFRGV
jgi:hypothetical protein